VNGYGVGVFFSQLFLDGGRLLNNGTGLAAINGANAKATNVTIQNNSNGIEIRTQSFVNTTATISGNTAGGVYVHESGTLSCPGCQITGNSGIGLILRRDSSARLYSTYAVTGNTGGGILLSEESSAYFPAPTGTVTGNTGGMDVYCGASYTTAKNATINIGGGTTNCVEPSPSAGSDDASCLRYYGSTVRQTSLVAGSPKEGGLNVAFAQTPQVFHRFAVIVGAGLPLFFW
jgi:hypothetical protein